MSATSSMEPPQSLAGIALYWSWRPVTKRTTTAPRFSSDSQHRATGCSAFSSIMASRRRTGRLMSPSDRRSGQARPTICCSSRNEACRSAREPLKQRLCCGWSANLGAIDEIHKTVVAALDGLPAEALGPTVERVRRIAGWFLLDAAPQPSVDKICGHRLQRRMLCVVDHRNGDPVPAQQLGKSRDREAPVAYFDDMAYRPIVEPMRQQIQESGEAGFVECLLRRELPQDGAELLAQLQHACRKEAVDRRTGCRQIAAVRNKARALQRENEFFRRLVVPTVKARRLLRTVKGSVDFDRCNLAARMGQFGRLRQSQRIEDAAPWRKHPPADPHPNFRSRTHQSPGSGTLRVEFRSAGSPTMAKLNRFGSSKLRATRLA